MPFFTGTIGKDTLIGTAGNDAMYGLAGDDYIEPGAGNDYVDGGDGNDTINKSLQDGASTLVGGAETTRFWAALGVTI